MSGTVADPDRAAANAIPRTTADAARRPRRPGRPRRTATGVLPVCVLLLHVLVLVPLVAEDLEKSLERGGFDPSRRAAVLALFDQAAAQGVPKRLLLPRLEEGLAKRVPAGRLLGVIERELGFLLRAREILSEENSALAKDEASWARTANLLAGGLEPGEVRALVRICSIRPRDYRPATYLYVAMVQWGLSQDQAAKLLEALLSSDLAGEQFGGIVELLVEARSARIPPERLLERILEALPRVQDLEELEAAVLY